MERYIIRYIVIGFFRKLPRPLLTGKPAVLYSQTSFNFVDFRLHSAEHSSELDALLSLARELRVFNAHSASVYALRAPMRDNI